MMMNKLVRHGELMLEWRDDQMALCTLQKVDGLIEVGVETPEVWVDKGSGFKKLFFDERFTNYVNKMRLTPEMARELAAALLEFTKDEP
jgi:hypothetical protein